MDLGELARALAVFAALDPTHTPLHHVQLFVEVARRGQCTYQDLEQELSLSNSAVSRTVNALGPVRRQGDAGHNLLETFRDPAEGRHFLVRLTPRGKAVARQLLGP